MKAMVLHKQGPLHKNSLILEDLPIPTPEKEEILIKVKVCAVCRTDLHLIEGDLSPRKLPIVPGHQAVGIVEETGKRCTRIKKGDRVGVAWLRGTCQRCSFCENGRENLCEASEYTGYDANGGYAEYTKIHERYAYTLPFEIQDRDAAPLLCAGIIGYHALKRSNWKPLQSLGIFGFGSSAHLIIQIVTAQGGKVFVGSRTQEHRDLARKLGAVWTGDTYDPFPEKVDSAIVFAPAGEVVLAALEAVKKGGAVSIAGISLTDIPPLNYESHLFHEKILTSVESNTREEGKEFLDLAAEIGVKPQTELFPLEQANEALMKLKGEQLSGTAVLNIF